MAAEQKDTCQIELARKLNHVPWCDEYEKMISGMLYDCLDPQLAEARFTARRWAHEYNTTFPATATDFPSLTNARLELLQRIIGHISVPPGSMGEEPFIEPPFNIDYGANIRLGERFYANFNLTVLDCALVTIGDRVMCGPNVSIFAATHETAVESRRRGVEYARPVTIGDDVWIGGGATILPGVTVGRGSTVAAGSVVTRDVPPFSVVKGAPARVVKVVEEVPTEDQPDGSG